MHINWKKMPLIYFSYHTSFCMYFLSTSFLKVYMGRDWAIGLQLAVHGVRSPVKSCISGKGLIWFSVYETHWKGVWGLWNRILTRKQVWRGWWEVDTKMILEPKNHLVGTTFLVYLAVPITVDLCVLGALGGIVLSGHNPSLLRSWALKFKLTLEESEHLALGLRETACSFS